MVGRLDGSGFMMTVPFGFEVLVSRVPEVAVVPGRVVQQRVALRVEHAAEAVGVLPRADGPLLPERGDVHPGVVMTIRQARLEDEPRLRDVDAATWTAGVSPAPPPSADAAFFGERTAPSDVVVAGNPLHAGPLPGDRQVCAGQMLLAAGCAGAGRAAAYRWIRRGLAR